MKKILFVALAAMTFVACTKNDEEMSPSEKGEKESPMWQSHLLLATCTHVLLVTSTTKDSMLNVL